MSGLLLGLNIATSALEAQQEALNVVSENVANAATSGYTRQRAVMTEGQPLGVNTASGYTVAGSGVNVTEVERVLDQYVNNQVRTATGQSSYWSTQSSALSQVESVFNEPSTNGIQSQLTAFWNAWSSLSTSPSSTADEQGVISAGKSLAEGIQTAYSSISQTQSDLTSKLSDDVTQINTITSEIAQLNKQINAGGTSGNLNTLLDSRDSLVNQLTGLAGVNVSDQNGSDFTVTLDNKILVQGNISDQLAVRNNAAGDKEVYSVSDGDTRNITGGEVGSILSLVNQTLPGYMNQLNNLATTLVTQVNALHTTGVLTDGTAAGDFFTAGSTAANISVAATAESSVASSTTGKLGDGSLASQISKLGSTTLASGLTINGMYQQLVSDVGTQSASASSTSQTQTLSLTQFQTQQQSVSGVSLDEEMTNMIKFQQAYSAAARVVSTVNSMLSTLINNTGLSGG